MSNNSMFNWSNHSLDQDYRCLIPQTIDSWDLFAECYSYHFKRNITKALLEIFLALGTVVANLLVIILLGTKKTQTRMSVFDKVIIGHAFVDGLTGLVDMPFFHINSIFGYFPISPVIAYLWASYDNNINMTTSLHMLYMSYVRIRSIQAPKQYLDEYLIKNPEIVMICIWASGLVTWIPIVLTYGIEKYTLNIEYGTNTSVKIVLNFITWFMPLVLIFLVSFQIVYLLNIRKKLASKRNQKLPKKSSNNNSVLNTASVVGPNKKSWNRRLFRYCFNYRFSAQTKFMIIISTYWIQWTIPCFLTILNPLCNYCVIDGVYLTIYWSTFTVCFVDPLIVLFLNPNVSCMRV